MKNERKIPKMWASVGRIVGRKCLCRAIEKNKKTEELHTSAFYFVSSAVI